MMRFFFLTSLFALLFGAGAGAFADTLTVEEGSSRYLVKRIVEKVGDRLRALVLDRDGREQKIYITADDVVEVKRGLWVIRPGTYQTEI